MHAPWSVRTRTLPYELRLVAMSDATTPAIAVKTRLQVAPCLDQRWKYLDNTREVLRI